MPAAEIETATVAQIKTVLSSPESVAAVCKHLQTGGAEVDEAKAVMAMVNVAGVWEQLFPVERHRIVNLMIERIDLADNGLKITWRALGWKALIKEFSVNTIGAEMLEVEARA